MSLKGYALLIMSLALDSFTAPHEEVVKKRYHPSVAQMMLHLNLWSAIVMAAGESIPPFASGTSNLIRSMFFFFLFPEM